MRLFFPSLIVFAVLAGCDTTAPLRQLEHTAPPADPYHRALAEGYQQFAAFEQTRYDWFSSEYFAEKGLAAAAGKPVAPEDADGRDISGADVPVLRDARSQLVQILTPANTAAWPVLSASAMVSYDCWVEVTEEGWDAPVMDYCRGNFERALVTLLQNTRPAPVAPVAPVATEAPVAPVATEAPSPPPAAAAEPAVQAASSIFYFPFDEYRLTGQPLEMLDRFIAGIQAAGLAEIIINGHADRAGSEEYNLALSERRARFVLDKLLAAGIDPSMISYYAFGETDPRVATADGVADQTNRRVEIFIE